MRYLLKSFLPFVLALLAGVALVYFLRERKAHTQPAAPPNAQRVEYGVLGGDLAAPAELHVLSTNLIDENVKYAGAGHVWKDLQVLSPPGVLYTAAKPQRYRQGVLQLRALFNADGTVTEIEPLAKRAVCGTCLPKGERVTEIDLNAPESRPRVAAAVLAVRQIKFVPCQSDGRPVPTHGLIECVFRLD